MVRLLCNISSDSLPSMKHVHGMNFCFCVNYFVLGVRPGTIIIREKVAKFEMSPVWWKILINIVVLRFEKVCPSSAM